MIIFTPEFYYIMVERVIGDWLEEFEKLGPNDLKSHYLQVVQNKQLVSAIYTYFEDIHKYYKVLNNVDVCSVLFKYYRTNEDDLKRFTLQFLPQILYTYLNAVAHGDKKTSRVMEALIIGIYNLEVVDENGQPRVTSFRLPSLAQSSIYHEPVSLAPASLTESALRRLEQRDSQLVRWGPMVPVDKLVAQNRLLILTELLYCYYTHISLLSKDSLKCLCKITTRIVTQGFSRCGNNGGMYRRSSLSSDGSVPLVLPRIPVSSCFLSQLLHCLYFAMFNGCKYESLQAIEDVYYRASYHCFSEVLLLSNAIKNSAISSPPGQPEDLPMGINVPASGVATTTGDVSSLSKSMITNASFRTKKLPDDIPIQDSQGDESGTTGLSSISEEKDEPSLTPETHPRKSIPKMAASLGKKTKEKIATAVKSVHKSSSVTVNGISEDESGIELCGSDISNANDLELTPYNSRKSNARDDTASKSIQTRL